MIGGKIMSLPSIFAILPGFFLSVPPLLPVLPLREIPLLRWLGLGASPSHLVTSEPQLLLGPP